MINRSMLELMNFASYAIEVPQSHVDAGMASSGPGAGLGSLRIQSSSSKPSSPWLSVEHKGTWFYIPYDDAASRYDFLLLQAMYNVSIGTVPGATPLLTLPVK